MSRLRYLILQFLPSRAPLLKGRASQAVMACWSRRRPPVAVAGQDAAVPGAAPDLGVQGSGAGDALVPPLVEVGLERVQYGRPAGGLDQQFIDAGCLGELQDGVAGQSQAAGDLADRAAVGAQRLDCRVAFAVPGDQAALVAVLIAEPVRLGLPAGLR